MLLVQESKVQESKVQESRVQESKVQESKVQESKLKTYGYVEIKNIKMKHILWRSKMIFYGQVNKANNIYDNKCQQPRIFFCQIFYLAIYFQEHMSLHYINIT